MDLIWLITFVYIITSIPSRFSTGIECSGRLPVDTLTGYLQQLN